MVFTEEQAREMQIAIEAFQKKDHDAKLTKRISDIAIEQTWFDSLTQIIKSPVLSGDALSNYREIEKLQKLQTNQIRLTILAKQKELANKELRRLKNIEGMQ